MIAVKLTEIGVFDSYGSTGLGAGSVFGILGTILENKDHEKVEKKATALDSLSPDQLLEQHKDNFQILYNDIEKIEAKKRTFLSPWGLVKIKGNLASMSSRVGGRTPKQIEVNIAKNQELDAWKSVLEKVLMNKLSIK